MTGLHIAADLDGTLAFHPDGPVSAIHAALHELTALPDVSLTVATARSPRVVGEWFSALSDRLGLVCCNGAIVRSPQRELHRGALDPIVVRSLVMWFRDRGERFCLEYGDRFAASHEDALPWMGTRNRIPMGEASPLLDGVVKVCVEMREIQARELALVAGDDATVFPHSTGDADVVDRAADKARGAALLHRPGDRLIALGNDRNDLGMLLAADRAIVVGDQLPELDACSHVTRVPSSPSAVADALSTMVFDRVAASA